MITLTFKQFKYAWTNALDDNEAKQLYDTYHVAGSGISSRADGQRQHQPVDAGEGEHEEPRPWPSADHRGREGPHGARAIAHAAYKRQRRNPGVTEIVKIPNRGHALTIDHGWREVAQTALDFVKRSSPDDPLTERRGRTSAKLGPRQRHIHE